MDQNVESKIYELGKETDEAYELSFPAFETKDPVFKNINIITHAGGGLQGMAYLNCAEAFPEYRNRGNTVFEYDVVLSDDRSFLLTHNEKDSSSERLNSKIDGRFSPMPLEHCLDHIINDDALYLIFDLKPKCMREFSQYLKDYIQDENVLNRIIIQVFEESDIAAVRSVYDYKLLYVCMYAADYGKVANCCLKNHIFAVSVSEKALEERTGWDVFIKSNICVFAYTVNQLDKYLDLMQKGVQGVFSDFLLEKDVNRASFKPTEGEYNDGIYIYIYPP